MASSYSTHGDRRQAAQAQLEQATLPGFPSTQLKFCPRCRSWLPTSLFSKHWKNEDGMQAYCKVCNRTQRASWVP